MWDLRALASGSLRRKSFSVLAAAAFLACAALPARAVELYELALPAPLTEIRKSGDETLAMLGGEVFQLLPCAAEAGICLETTDETGLPERAPPDALPDGLAGRGLSGADIESIALSAKRKALTEGRETLTRADLDRALADFIPSAQGLEKETQELAAVLECTSMGFLPEDWQARIQAPEGRARLQQRMAEIRRLIED